MKQVVFIFIALFLCFTKNGQAQELRDGYVVLAKRDTINCKIVFGGPKGTDKTQISIVTKEGEEKIFKTKDKKVFAYGFNQVGVPFDYLFVDRGIKVETGFYKLVEKGDPYKLYIQNINSTTKGVTVTTSYYILFDENGDSIDFFVSGVSGWKKKLEVFFENDPEALEKLEDVSRQDIVKFIKSLNEN
ncbi:hypothetical protein [Aquiflexum gelatinilyticum]|uniref:Uncharacterized protein n=1 Tax=Aquiflexum gelatinilyticum TaxID=2961943 RepID=A0A9X2P4M6_9BACT|nr:hypothetical protein [Aquiflexum gelatinilyticum]MCR9014716.1 hypothetical protein [Aquiflexum gelatinilyticum]